MIIIVEGPDGSGKSHLITKLVDETGFPVFHSGGPGKSQKEITKRTLTYLSYDRVIFDRFPVISENVYGPLLRSVEYLHFGLWRNVLTEKNPLIIYCRPSFETILNVKLEEKSHKTRDHIKQVESRLGDIVQNYDDIMSYFKYVKFDRDKETCAELIWRLDLKM